MERDPLLTLAGLALVAAFAGGIVWLMLRQGKALGRHDGLIAGYPPDRFPLRDLATLPALAALAGSQGRLLHVYAQLPARSEAAVWLRAYLSELRAIMDTAYKVAGIAALYGDTAALERVAAEVAESESYIAHEAMQHMLRGDAALDGAVLDDRLAVLRRFAHELAGASAGR
ncbi:MAG: hypothetical protein HGA45_09280 [Chloroflexales bacterium]|nr:hypothetical protein [Chloroflexales bacterium]